MINLNLIIFGAFFAYGVFTLQRNGFLLDFMQGFWKKIAPKKIHEPLYSCGVCVASIWGIFFMLYYYGVITFIQAQFQYFALIPLFIVAMSGITALLDRAVKFFEYGYKYTNIKPLSNYSYLENYEFRDSMILCFLQKAITDKATAIIEVGGYTEAIYRAVDTRYRSFDKAKGKDIIQTYVAGKYFVVIKGLAFEGNFDYLQGLLVNSCGFVVEGSLAGDSGKQLNWIMEAFPEVIKMPYMTNEKCESPSHCGGDINNRIVLVKK